MPRATIVILSAGVMGSAFTVPLADDGHVVPLVGTHLDDDIIAAVRQDHSHPRLRAHLPESVVPYTRDQLDEAMCAVDLIILGVSCAGVNWAAERLGAVLPQDVPLVMLTKGLRGDGQTIDILPRVLKRQLPAWYRGPVGAIGGPSIAGELAVRRQTNVPLAGPDKTLVEDLAEWLRTSYDHVWPDTDVVGVEVCAALKNLYGLGVGQAAGMLEGSPAVENEAKMHTLAAALFAEALWEMAYLVAALGGRPCAVWMLAGAGDLYVTCQAGRNSRMGRWLGRGMRYSEAKARHTREDTVEDAETALAIGPTVDAMIERGAPDKAALPLTRAIMDTVCRDTPGPIPWDEFFASPAGGATEA